MRDPIESYFTHLRDVHSSGAGVAETSYYPALQQLLTDLGHKLKPKVTAIINLRNTGGGIPDGGLFTASQLKGWEPGENPLQGQLPARGAIEVKGTGDDAFEIAASEQVARYVERYGLVLVTNLRDFVLVGRHASGSGVQALESCRLAETEAGFWARIAQPHKFAEDAGEGLAEFLRRALLHNAPLSDPKDLAWFLASYARTARLRLESRHELPALEQLRGQLEESLGLKFEGEKGDHFFRSTLVQTLFYGMFASWVLWARDKDRAAVIDWRERFQWETASQTLHVPMVAELFYQFSNPGRLRDLHIDEVLEWAEEVLWRIDRVSFFEKFQEEHAVQYFYEPFLEAFDPQLRKELGVWYTPDEVVKYMVARVDWALREELGIADGLADPSVVVLDPCCGTGAFLVEVLRKIDQTLAEKGADALTRNDVKRAAMERVIGFEIMPAPFVVAHLQMGILLAELGVPLKHADERAAVYLTNALTGWGDGGAVAPPKDKRVHPDQMHSTLLFPEFAEERDAADRVKREEKVLVIIGNPPYNGYAGMAVDEERELSDTYRRTAMVARPQGQGLNDLYVRFFRLAERQIASRAGRGVVALITNYSWLDGLSYTGMRESLLDSFDRIYVDCLNGDKYRTGKVTPDGEPDPSIFSTPLNREGIQLGTAVTLMVRAAGTPNAQVFYRDLWGKGKREQLDIDARRDSPPDGYKVVVPALGTGLTIGAGDVGAEYLTWPRLTDLFAASFPGVKTSNDSAVVAIDRDSLTPSIGSTTRIVRYHYRPMDVRWLAWEPPGGKLDRPRPEFLRALEKASGPFLESRQRQNQSYDRGGTVKHLADAIGNGMSVFFPLMLPADGLMSEGTANLTREGQRYLVSLGCETDSLFYHAVAVLNCPEYRRANAGPLRCDWARVPLPASAEVLRRSADLGRLLSSVHDSEDTDVLCDTRVPDFAGRISSVSGAPLDPASNLGVTVRWGISGQGGTTMPSTGRVTERPYSDYERAAIAEGVKSRGMSVEQAIALLGDTCFDVWLNDVAYWRCVPANVWRYTIGGYQVIKKWLSYRERALLGRDLKPEEARYVTEMVRRIAALVLMGPELDANYERVKSDVWDWGKAQ